MLLGAYLFGGVTMLQLHLQARGVHWPPQFMSMLPYLATVAARGGEWARQTDLLGYLIHRSLPKWIEERELRDRTWWCYTHQNRFVE